MKQAMTFKVRIYLDGVRKQDLSCVDGWIDEKWIDEEWVGSIEKALSRGEPSGSVDIGGVMHTWRALRPGSEDDEE